VPRVAYHDGPGCTISGKSIDRYNFLNLRNFETEGNTSEKHQVKSLDLQEIYQFDISFFVVSCFIPMLPRFKILERSVGPTFMTASTNIQCTGSYSFHAFAASGT